MPGLMQNSRAAQVYQASGEATEQAKLPDEFKATPQPSSPLSDHMNIPKDFSWCDAPVVHRAPRMNGYRMLYSRGMTRMPVRRDGADGTPRPWNSGANLNDMGPIRQASFNDALYQAGYPGYNLGLSFKLPNDTRSRDTTNLQPPLFKPINIRLSDAVNKLTSKEKGPRRRGTTESNYDG